MLLHARDCNGMHMRHTCTHRALLRRLAPLAAATAALSTIVFAGTASGAAGDYPGALYLSAAQSAEVTESKSYELLGSLGLAPPSAAPSVTATTGGSLSGTYRYVYAFVDAVAGETTPSASTQGSTNAFTNLKQFTVAASSLPVPDGTAVRLYRFKSGRYNLVTELAVSAGSFSYVDNTADATVNASPILPQAENRVPWTVSTPVLDNPTTSATGGTLPAATYYYKLTATTASGESLPSAERSVATTGDASTVTLTWAAVNGTTGYKVYRSTSSGTQTLLAALGDVTGFTDTGSLAPGTQTPPTSNTATVTGYAAFDPGKPVSASTTDNSAVTATAPAAPTGKGWLVDGPGNVYFAAGTWTFVFQTRSVHSNGVAHLVVGMWKVTTSGGSIASSALVLDPNDPSAEDDANLITSLSTTQTVAHAVALPSFTLGPGEHLYVQLWRRQTGAYTTSGGTESRIATLFANDGIARVERPAVSTLPNAPTLASPADSAVTSARTLSAYFSDPDAGDSGQVEFRVCAAPAAAGIECSPAVESGSSSSVANGAPASWTAGAGLAYGTPLHWQARAVDALGGRSAWTATRSFTLNDAPASPALSRPLAGALVRSSTPPLRAAYADANGDSGKVRFRICLAPSAAGSVCTPGVAAGLSGQTSNGAIAAWQPGSSLRDRTYYWQARSEDAFGVPSAWSQTRKLVVAQRLVRIMSPRRLVCTVGAKVSVKLRLAAAARVSAGLFTRSRLDLEYGFGRLAQGSATLTLSLPYSLQRPAIYWVQWTALRRGERTVASMRVDLRRPNGRPPSCGLAA